MITFTTGKPGGGKTLRAMQFLFDHLHDENDTRNIVTNVPLNLDEIQDYCHRHGLNVDVTTRIYVLDEELYKFTTEKRFPKLDWLRKFYLFRGDHNLIEWEPNTDLEDYFKPLFIDAETGNTTGVQGVVYIIDETRKLYPARNFQKMDGRVFDYFGLHRHFGDDVMMICQFVGQVDKQIRGYGQSFEVIRNRVKEKYSIFRGEARFTRYAYLEPPTSNVSAMETTTFKLNTEQANCYSTSAMGGGADKGQRAKGIHFYWFYVAVALAVLIAYFALGEAPELILSHGINKDKDNTEILTSDPSIRPSFIESSSPVVTVPSPVRTVDTFRGVYVRLMDGTEYYGSEDGIDTIHGYKGVKINGVWHRYAKPSNSLQIIDEYQYQSVDNRNMDVTNSANAHLEYSNYMTNSHNNNL